DHIRCIPWLLARALRRRLAGGLIRRLRSQRRIERRPLDIGSIGRRRIEDSRGRAGNVPWARENDVADRLDRELRPELLGHGEHGLLRIRRDEQPSRELLPWNGHGQRARAIAGGLGLVARAALAMV